ncbi:SGNH hydrolase-type esterase domain-containing protein [Aspergillus varians]
MGILRLQRCVAWALTLSSLLLQPLGAAAGLPDLRIMPLGDSITKGNLSPQMNGYRQPLRQSLLSEQMGTNATTDMIGSLQDGSMQDNDHEGHSGKYLADIREYLELSLPAKPNVVCVHAGSNNMDLEVDLDIADSLIESIIDRLFDGSPGVTVLVAPVIWANDTRMQANTDVFNDKLAVIIDRKQGGGEHILSVPIDITLGDLADKKHPNEEGYRKMAVAWYNAIVDAHGRGWIRAPAKVNADDLPGMGLGYRDTAAESNGE